MKQRPPGFIGELDTRLVDEAKGIDKTLAPFGFYSELLKAEVWIPGGFETDWASVPRWPLAYLMFGGKGKRAALIHDGLYSGILVNGKVIDRERADKVFAEALRASGYTTFTEGVMFAAVRIGGEGRYALPNVPQDPHVQALMAPANAERFREAA